MKPRSLRALASAFPGRVRIRPTILSFLCSTRAGATAYVAAAVAVMTVLGGALITDHVWLIDKRDLLKNAATAASLTATAELGRLPQSMADAEVETHLKKVVHNYVWINVRANTRSDLKPEDVVVTLDIDRGAGVVNAAVEADIGETLFSFLYPGPKTVRQATAAEQRFQPAEVVLAIDTSGSMYRNINDDWGGRSRLDIVKEAANNLIDAVAPDDSGPVALGLVPWTDVVRLDGESRRRWHSERWTEFPSRRLYLVPYTCRPRGRCEPESVVQDIPASTRGRWDGCVDEYRSMGGVTQLPSMEDALELPSRTAFAESYFPPGNDQGGRAYQCLGASVPDNFDYQFCWTGASNDDRQYSTNSPQRYCRGVRPHDSADHGNRIHQEIPECPLSSRESHLQRSRDPMGPQDALAGVEGGVGSRHPSHGHGPRRAEDHCPAHGWRGHNLRGVGPGMRVRTGGRPRRSLRGCEGRGNRDLRGCRHGAEVRVPGDWAPPCAIARAPRNTPISTIPMPNHCWTPSAALPRSSCR